MKIEFDPKKSAKKDRERGLPFDRTAELDWSKAIVSADVRRDYGESRLVALVPMRQRLYVVCYSYQGEVRRIISFRKGNRREEKIYEQAIADR